MKNQLKLSESAIEDLKNRLDDAMNAEDMLEQLTEKNLAQGEVIKSCYVIGKKSYKLEHLYKIGYGNGGIKF